MAGPEVLEEVDLNEKPATSASGLQVLGEEDLPAGKSSVDSAVDAALRSVPRPASPTPTAVPTPADMIGAGAGNEAEASKKFYPSALPKAAAQLPSEAIKALDVGPGEIAHGVGDIVKATTQTAAHPQPSLPEAERGASRTIRGIGTTSLPFAPEAALESPTAVVGGYVAGKGAEALTKYLTEGKVSPETEELLQTLAFWAPSLTGQFLRPRAAVESSPEGTGVAATVLGGKAGLGARVTPEAVTVKGKVGPFEATKTFPRGNAGPAIEPPTIEATPPPPPDPAVEAMVKSKEMDVAAERVSQGLPPTPPPPAPPKVSESPNAPPSVQAGQISPTDVSKAADAIFSLPEALRGIAIQEAHNTLAKVLYEQGQKGPVILPDGKLALVKDPATAEKTAVTLINTAIEEHDQRQADAAKAAKEQKPSEVSQSILSARSGIQTGKRSETTQPQVLGEEDLGETAKAPAGLVPLGEENLIKKGDLVKLPGGEVGTVHYISETNDSIARVEVPVGNGKTKRVSIQPSKLKPANEEPNAAENKPVAGEQPKFQYRSTQANIEPDTEAGKALSAARDRVSAEDLAGKGKDVGENHVTVRYGLDSDDTSGVKQYLSNLAPFEATLGATQKFPPSESSDGAAVIHAPIESPELRKINEELAKFGQFIAPTFDYKPHATVAYVKPEKADRYVGMNLTRGKKFKVSSVAITDRNGGQEVVPLSGTAKEKAPETDRMKLGLPPKVGEVGQMKVSHLHVAPHKFQYKLGTDATGTGTLLKETKVFNPDLAGVVSVWKGPDGKTYVINGHHRFELAKRTGQKQISVRHIVAKDEAEARAVGARQNIAEGRGTPVDAAKFFRETGITPEDLDKHGISLGEATASKGLALANLDESLFQRVVQGDLTLGRAVAIGESTKDHAEQKAIVSMLERKEKSGVKVSDATLSELIRLVKGSEQTTETTQDLFGAQHITRSLAIEKAEISAYIKQQIAKDKKLFGFVAKEGRAQELERAGNKIDVERSKEISTGAAQAEEVYNKLSERGGPISGILDESARRLADGENAATVKSEAYQRIRAEISNTLPGAQRSVPKGLEEGTGRPEEKGVSLFRLREPTEVPAAFRPVASNFGELEEKFDALGSPNYISGDLTKELLPGWENKDDRAELENKYHADASRLGYLLFRAKLADVKPGENVLLITGPIAAGKTTASAEARSQAALTYEAGLSNSKVAESHIDAILAQGARPNILYVYNSPANSAVRRALRASADGRSVSIHRPASKVLHLELPQTLEKLADKYGDKLGIQIRDNSGEQAVTRPFTDISKLVYHGDEHDLIREQQAALDRARDLKQISDRIHKEISARGVSQTPDRRDHAESGEGSGRSPQERPDEGRADGNREPQQELTRKALFNSPAPPFYSKAARVAFAKLPEAASGDSMLATLRNAGVKEDEIKWIGLDDFLAEKAKVLKRDVLDFIHDNMVKVVEVERSDRPGTGWSINDGEFGQDEHQYFVKMPNGRKYAVGKGVVDNEEEAKAYLQRQLGTIARQRGAPSTKFASYTLPGEKSNYTELLLTLPEGQSKPVEMADGKWTLDMGEGQTMGVYDTRESAELGSKTWKQTGFRSSHFETPNILAHVRFDDRTDTEGNKILFVEEVQSDWHQRGKRSGYTTGAQERFDALKREVEARHGKPLSEIRSRIKHTAEEEKDLAAIDTAYSAAQEEKHGNKVPDAPFKSDWHELAMKTMLRKAAEGDYEKLGWVTGQQTADRYDLSRHIHSINWQKNSDGSYDLSPIGKDGSGVPGASRSHTTLTHIGDLVGKEVAAKIEAGVGKNWDDGKGVTQGRLEGVDLKIGGEWARSLYDRAIPNFLNRYGKKWGTKVADTKLQLVAPKSFAEFSQQHLRAWPESTPEQVQSAHKTYGNAIEETVHSVQISPEMKRSVLEEGQPLFHAGETKPLITGRSPLAINKIAREARLTLVRSGPHLPSRVEANRQALMILSAAEGRPMLGVNMEMQSANDLRTKLNQAVEKGVFRNDPEASAAVKQMTNQIAAATRPDTGLIITPETKDADGIKTAMEELFHGAVQRKPGGQGEILIPYKQMRDDPGIRAMAYRITGEYGNDYKPIVVIEGMADVFVGEADELSAEQAEKTASKYFAFVNDEQLTNAAAIYDHADALAAQHGIIQPGEVFNGDATGPARQALNREIADRHRKPAPRSGSEVQPEARAGHANAGNEGNISDATVRSDAGIAGDSREPIQRTDSAQLRLFRPNPENEWQLQPAHFGLEDDDVESWSRSKNFTIEPAGEQGDLFGQPEPIYRLSNGRQTGIASERQLQRVAERSPAIEKWLRFHGKAVAPAPKEDLPESEFQLTPSEAPKNQPDENQPSLFAMLTHDESGSFTPKNLADAAKQLGDYLGEEARANLNARKVQNGIYDLESQYSADVIRAVQRLKAIVEKMGDHAAVDDEAIYHHLENPDEPLNSRQDGILDDDILPVMQDSEDLYRELTQGGVPAEHYVHRVVKGRGSILDRIATEAKRVGRGNTLSKSAPQTKGRTMMALEADNAGGRRIVVAIKGNRVTSFNNGAPEDLGSLPTGMATKLDLLNEHLEPLAKKIIELKSRIAAVPEEDKASRLSNLAEQIAEFKKQRDLLSTVKGRVIGQRAVYGREVTFGKRKSLSEKIENLERERARIQSSGHMSDAGEERVRRLKEQLTVVEGQRDRILERYPTSQLMDKVWVDKNGKRWKITQATTKEIEKQTDLEYYHSAAASAFMANLQLRKAVRGMRFIEQLKQSPNFKDVAWEGKGNPPEGWRQTTLPQLRGYYLEPHLAEVMDWYAARLQSEGPGLFDQVGGFMRAAMLINPLMHPLNVGASWAVQRGATGFLPNHYFRMARAGAKAMRAVWEQNQDFQDALDAGAALQSFRKTTAELTNLFFERLTGAAAKKEPWAVAVAKYMGFDPKEFAPLVKPLHEISGKVAWLSNDFFVLQSAYETQMNHPGMSLRDALKQVTRVIPDYRLPTRLLNSRALGKLFSEQRALLFAPYHYGLLKSFPEIAKSAFGAQEPPPGSTKGQEVAHGWDMLAAMGLIALGLYPALDYAARKLTADQNAKVRRSGQFGIIENLRLLMKKEKTPTQVATSILTPNPATKALVEGLFNHELENGREIYDPTASWKTIASQVEQYLIDSVSTFGQVQSATQSKSALRKFEYSQVGVSFPRTGAERVAQEIAQAKESTSTFTPEERKSYYLRQDILDALRKGDSGPLNKAMAKGEITGRQEEELKRRARMTWLQDKVHGFSYSEVLRVYDAPGATEEQKRELDPVLREKRRNLILKGRRDDVENAERVAQ